jgi:23S rRNA (cytosine1962-C5)-methyltransferase
MGVEMMPATEEGRVRIHKRGVARIRNGHLWVYRSDIADVLDVPPGGITTVCDERDAVIGKAFYSSTSQIALRFLVRGEKPVDESFFRRRFQSADALRRLVGANPQLSRRIYSEGDLLPGLIVDKYGDYLVVQSLTQSADRLQPFFASLLQELYEPRSIIFRNDIKVRELEGLPLGQSSIGETPPETITLADGDKQVDIPLLGGQKTGAFLDQSENRRAARRYASGRALDGFCYGGGFALHMADVCESVEAVDLSAAAIELTRSNAARNQIQNITSIEANVFDFLRERFSMGERYDTIVLDPPAFARNKESLEGALRGYKEINNRAMRLLRNGGVLLTCSCSHHVSEALFAEMLAEAARDAGCWARVLERRIQSADHPVLLSVPETLYLKCFILQIMY